MTFFGDIKNSIYNPEYYKGLMSKPFSYSLKYFLLLVLLLTFLYATAVCFDILPNLKLAIDAIQSGLINHYPAELEITVSKGKVSTNVPEPYFIKWPTSLPKEKSHPNVENILVIDTKNGVSLEEFKNYKTFCLLSQQEISCYDKNEAIKIQTLGSMADFKINKPAVVSFVAKIRPFIPFIYPLISVLVFIGTFLGFLFTKLFYLIFGALLVWLITKIQKNNIGYKKSYQLGLHLITLPLILHAVLPSIFKFFGIYIHIFPYFLDVVFLIVLLSNIKKQNNITSTI